MGRKKLITTDEGIDEKINELCDQLNQTEDKSIKKKLLRRIEYWKSRNYMLEARHRAYEKYKKNLSMQPNGICSLTELIVKK